jgi:hypothetical protein
MLRVLFTTHAIKQHAGYVQRQFPNFPTRKAVQQNYPSLTYQPASQTFPCRIMKITRLVLMQMFRSRSLFGISRREDPNVYIIYP